VVEGGEKKSGAGGAPSSLEKKRFLPEIKVNKDPVIFVSGPGEKRGEPSQTVNWGEKTVSEKEKEPKLHEENAVIRKPLKDIVLVSPGEETSSGDAHILCLSLRGGDTNK